MPRAGWIAVLLAGCAAPPNPRSPESNDFLPVVGAPASRLAGRVLSLDPPAARIDDPRGAPAGLVLVARDPMNLRATALLRVIGGRGQVAMLALERGTPRLGDELVEPAPSLLAEARRLPAP